MRFYLLALAFCAMFSAALISLVYGTEHLAAWLLWGALAFVWLLPFIEDLALNRFDIFELKNVFLAYYGMHFVVWTGVILATGRTRWNVPVDEYFNEGIFMALVGLAAFLVGCRSGFAHTLSRVLPTPPGKWDPLRYRIAVGVCLILGVLAFLQLMTVVGGVSAYLADRETYRGGGLVGKSYLVKPATFVLSIPAMLLFSRSRTRRGMALALGVFVLGLIPAAVIGFRTAILFPMLQLVIFYHYARRRLTIKAAVCVFGSIFVFMAIFGLWRDVGDTLGDDLAFDTGSKIADATFRLLSRSHGGEIVAIIKEGIDRQGVPLEWGLVSALEVATVVVPRDLYPDKVEDNSFRFSRTFFSGLIPRGGGGVPPTVIGELYWNFSWPGVVAGMWFLGVFCQAAYLWMKGHWNHSAIIVYGVFAGYIFFLVEAPIVATDAYWPNIAFLAGILWFISPTRLALPVSALRLPQKQNG